MRKVLLDTETTGLSFDSDRIWEIGCVEVVEYEQTGNIFHYYLNPQKLLSDEAAAITGMKNSFLLDKPLFSKIVQEFLNFIDGATIVAHNAAFDIQMINSELKRCGIKPLTNQVIDTLKLAREVYPGGNNTLDALARKFKVNHDREYHGALKDARDLASIYYYLMDNYSNSVMKNKSTLFGAFDSASINDLSISQDTIEFSRENPNVVSAEDKRKHIEFCQAYGIEAY